MGLLHQAGQEPAQILALTLACPSRTLKGRAALGQARAFSPTRALWLQRPELCGVKAARSSNECPTSEGFASSRSFAQHASLSVLQLHDCQLASYGCHERPSSSEHDAMALPRGPPVMHSPDFCSGSPGSCRSLFVQLDSTDGLLYRSMGKLAARLLGPKLEKSAQVHMLHRLPDAVAALVLAQLTRTDAESVNSAYGSRWRPAAECTRRWRLALECGRLWLARSRGGGFGVRRFTKGDLLIIAEQTCPGPADIACLLHLWRNRNIQERVRARCVCTADCPGVPY